MSASEPASARALAQKHVKGGRNIVAAQEALVESLKARGENTDVAEDLLKSFRRTLAQFEEELRRLSPQ